MGDLLTTKFRATKLEMITVYGRNRNKYVDQRSILSRWCSTWNIVQETYSTRTRSASCIDIALESDSMDHVRKRASREGI